MTIQQYDFDIEHRAGKANGNADAMSRYPFPHNPPLCQVNAITPGFKMTDLYRLQREEPDINAFIQYFESSILPEDSDKAKRILLQQDEYCLHSNGLLYHLWKPTTKIDKDWRLQLVVPTSLKSEVLFQMHEEVTAGHFGLSKTYEKLRNNYYWPKMYADCEHYVRSCTDCATKKMPKGNHKAPLLPLPVEGPFDRVGIDCLGPFPVTYSNNKYIVVLTDYLTKWPEAFAVSNIEAATIAEILVDQILCRHGAPRTLLSDRGSNFLSKLIVEVCKLINTKKVNTTAYHPQTDGLVERFNGTLAQSLSMYTSSNQKDLDVYIPSVLFGYRVSNHPSTGDSPFYLLYGREPRLPLDVALTPPKDLSSSIMHHRETIVSKITIAQEVARENIGRAQSQMKEYHDRRAAIPNLNVGDRVWMYTPAVPKGLTKKLRHLWHGPYRIIEKLSAVHFQLATCDNRKVTTKVHANRMKLFHDRNDRPIGRIQDDITDDYLVPTDLPTDSFEPQSDDTHQPPGTDPVDIIVPQPQPNCNDLPDVNTSVTPTDPTPALDSDVYSVECLVAVRKHAGKTQYLVKWLGYPVTANTWEPAENIIDKRLIEHFEIQTNGR